MRCALAPLLLSLAVGCTPPPKVAGHSRATAPPARRPAPSAAPSPPPPSGPAESRPIPQAPPTDAPPVPILASGQELGTAGSLALEAVSKTGSYFAYCQPTTPGAMKLDERGRATAPLSLTLAIGTERLPIDELLATDPSGRFVVTLERGAPILRDTSLHEAFPLTSLGIDLARDALSDHRSIAFSTNGTELGLLTQVGGADPALTILDLAAPNPLSAPRTVRLPSTSVWRVSAEGDVFVVTSVTSNGKGPGWPVRPAPERNLRCAQGTFDAFARVSGPLRDPALNHALVRRGQTSAEPAPGFVMATNGSWVRREDDGRLVVVQGKQQRQLASARCGGRILGAEPKTGWFLVSCEEYRPVKAEAPKPSSKKKPPPPKTRFPLYLLKPGIVRDPDVEIMRFGVDVPPVPGQRFTAVRAEAGLLLVDFSKGRWELLATGDRLLLATNTDVLLTSSGKIVRWADGTRQELGPIGSLVPTVASPAATPGAHALAVGPHLYRQRIDANQGSAWESQTLERAPLALGAGFALVPAAEASVGRWARGPVSVVLTPPDSEKPEPEPAETPAAVAGR